MLENSISYSVQLQLWQNKWHFDIYKSQINLSIILEFKDGINI